MCDLFIRGKSLLKYIKNLRFSSPGFSVLGQNNCPEFKLTNKVISFYILSNKIQSSDSLVCMVLPTFERGEDFSLGCVARFVSMVINAVDVDCS